MSVTAKDFHESAKALAENLDEMSKRNAISRAYYAAYHCAQGAFPEKRNSWDDSVTGIHKKYCDQLMQADGVERKVGIKLQAMHSRRTEADYKCSIDLKTQQLAMQMAATIEIFALVKSHQNPASTAA